MAPVAVVNNGSNELPIGLPVKYAFVIAALELDVVGKGAEL